MRKKIVAGNWKMHTNIREGVALASAIDKLIQKKPVNSETGIVIAPPLTHLSLIGQVIDNERICLTAQNCAAESKGAFTGEVSAKMLKSIGCKAVIIGHSERRAYYGETDEILSKKVNLLLENNLKPIFCCGEQLEEREKENHFNIIKAQIENALFDLSEKDFSEIVIAYEPVWAIGTGVTASAAQAQEMQAFIRKIIAEKYGKNIADDLTILYGGSVKPGNAKDIFSQPDVDGGLIGGAALDAESFYSIIDAA